LSLPGREPAWPARGRRGKQIVPDRGTSARPGTTRRPASAIGVMRGGRFRSTQCGIAASYYKTRISNRKRSDSQQSGPADSRERSAGRLDHRWSGFVTVIQREPRGIQGDLRELSRNSTKQRVYPRKARSHRYHPALRSVSTAARVNDASSPWPWAAARRPDRGSRAPWRTTRPRVRHGPCRGPRGRGHAGILRP
jgi:hypothetical protein